MTRNTRTFNEEWQAVLDGDRAALNRLVKPHLEELIHAARRDIQYYQRPGDLHPGDLSPEELVGESLLRAWSGRRQRPDWVSIKAWMLGVQHRVLQKLIQADHVERDLWAVSLQEAVPPEPLFDDEESFWEWYQPDDLTTWEDVISADQAPSDAIPAGEEIVEGLDPELRQVLLLHDEHALSLAEVALTLGRTVRETATLLGQARESLGQTPPS